jgi:hypothetical protein
MLHIEKSSGFKSGEYGGQSPKYRIPQRTAGLSRRRGPTLNLPEDVFSIRKDTPFKPRGPQAISKLLVDVDIGLFATRN